ncbi:MAG: tricarballylate utilization protein TcuB, partial [Vicinamibacterales bacterium]
QAGPAQFYEVIPHHIMVLGFGGVFGWSLLVLWVGGWRFWRHADEHPVALTHAGGWIDALRDIATLRNLHAHGTDCTDRGEEQRSPWRRRFHHATFYGFLFCFASTSVAAFYHLVLGWEAPYGYTSAPVVLGTIGGLGLVLGPTGLLWQRMRRDPALMDPGQRGLDAGFGVLLLTTSLTGLLLLVGRETRMMPALLAVHLGTVLALFVTLPYSKFVHGVYRSLALLKHALENRRPEPHVGSES